VEQRAPDKADVGNTHNKAVAVDAYPRHVRGSAGYFVSNDYLPLLEQWRRELTKNRPQRNS